MFSETRYARNGDLRVAYRASAPGERDIVFVPNWFTCCEVIPEMPVFQGWIEAMASLGRFVFFDQPGTGGSDPVASGALPTLEQWTDSITAVLDELGSREAVLLAVDGAFAPAALYAATHPSRTTALIALECYARTTGERRADRTVDEFRTAMAAAWGTGTFQRVLNPEMPWNEEIRSVWARHERMAASPGIVALMLPLLFDLDVRALLPAIRVPTLIVQHTGDSIITAEMGKYLADHITDAKYVELPGRNMYQLVEPGWRASFQEVAGFLTGHRTDFADDRVLATVLFTDIVGSTRMAAQLGDSNWRALLDAHDAVVRSQLTRFRGREVNTSGDGFLATFDGPQRAIRCAMAIRDAVQALGIEVRAGLHTGECELRGDDIGGIAVHIGARVSALAQANEVLVSSTLRDLVIGSGLEFDDRGAHTLKGVPGEWHLFAVAT
ncbi:adenylate/guanylate cyclase domain-containing protein [Mycobacterium sp. ITM-2016-00318]|uniref:adenylate/guanylate cyclase domain-containing protein n=1 Tax=Mycobacterium sp. ITM-2016-00318 TaxID=2099693 RepID=UPI000CFA19DA|nr:adenylate/guanylate cyclase domain-containing protein [Mycobacterium sp. ITM-2016-00318]WNG92892.1 adenylate/guanylate cyclase domain-containing protein [Mycobacterium sp. ITM-2016-00318]